MHYTVPKGSITGLFRNLQNLGYTVVGPSLSEGVVRLRELTGPADLAAGVVDVQAPGRYSLGKEAPLVFSSVNGPDSPKRYLHPADVELSRLIDGGGCIESVSGFHSNRKYAFFGIRPCDLRAVGVMDRTMLMPGFEDRVYSALRNGAIFIVVNCTRAGENCFCASMGTGPGAESGYDVSITELPEVLLVDVPKRSASLFQGIELKPATKAELRAGEEMVQRARDQMGRRIAEQDPSKQMYAAMDSPAWGRVAERCLSCGNCTMVCPTCFCNTVIDRNDLRDGSVSRVRVWDSCLSKDFVYSAGGNPRLQRMSRYRQFVMHKFAYWPDEFGTYGCVGCGRCITWCPVGIDIAETVNSVLRDQLAAEKKMEAHHVA
ncbi:MAG TPA: 4Fe-4S dicluster domain-containing protein [Nitrososphaerales archaeon]|nr:4Fe-4S dicluster domain-containing protein [Nitrososphaerales archaeon]